MKKSILYLVISLLSVVVASSCSNNNRSSHESDTNSYDVTMKIHGVAEDKLVDLIDSDFSMGFQKIQNCSDGDLYTMTMPLTFKISDEAIANKVEVSNMEFFLSNSNGMGICDAGEIRLHEPQIAEINTAIASGKKEVTVVLTHEVDEDFVLAAEHWGIERIYLSLIKTKERANEIHANVIYEGVKLKTTTHGVTYEFEFLNDNLLMIQISAANETRTFSGRWKEQSGSYKGNSYKWYELRYEIFGKDALAFIDENRNLYGPINGDVSIPPAKMIYVAGNISDPLHNQIIQHVSPLKSVK